MPFNVERVLDRLGIRYERAGHHLEALCPYHEDHRPSWRIRRAGEKRGLHFCQACKEGGDLVELVMQVRGFGLRESAREWLERHEFNEEDLEVPIVRMSIVREKKPMKMPVGVVLGKLLEDWPGPARKEVERRGITEDQVLTWDLGYAVEGRLAGRVVVPVYNRHGELASYMARTYCDQTRRYLYPAEEEGADMSTLFGEWVWPEYHPKSFTCIVTEGAFKSLAVERAVGGSVMEAALGGSPTPPAASTVAKLASFGRVLVFTDNDPSGNRCGDALEEALRGHVTVARAKLPPGEDADEVDPERLRGLLGSALQTVGW